MMASQGQKIRLHGSRKVRLKRIASNLKLFTNFPEPLVVEGITKKWSNCQLSMRIRTVT